MEQNNELAKISEEFSQLIFEALDHGIESVKTGETVIPFVWSKNAIERFVDTDQRTSLKRAEEYAKSQKNTATQFVIVYDGFSTTDGIKYDVVFGKAVDTEQNLKLLFGQKYTKLTGDVLRVGNVSYFGTTE